ncbi:MAG: hypothetical protein ABSD45_24375 [Terriglobia bacterium]
MHATIIQSALGVELVLLAGLWLFGERWRFLRPSAWQVMREGGIGLDALRAYVCLLA